MGTGGRSGCGAGADGLSGTGGIGLGLAFCDCASWRVHVFVFCSAAFCALESSLGGSLEGPKGRPLRTAGTLWLPTGGWEDEEFGGCPEWAVWGPALRAFPSCGQKVGFAPDNNDSYLKM